MTNRTLSTIALFLIAAALFIAVFVETIAPRMVYSNLMQAEYSDVFDQITADIHAGR